jgi:hypothetical protein
MARRRLMHAEDALADAERVEELAETNVHRRGGPCCASTSSVARLVRAHERTFIAGLEKWRCEHALAEAINQDGGQHA